MVFSPRGHTLTDNLTLRLELTPVVEQAWQRLALGNGASSDLNQVLGALSRLWSTNSSDPRAVELWLTNHGLDDRSPKEMLLQAKAKFDEYQVAKRIETERLIQGISSGPNLSVFFSGLRDAPFELKHIAYRRALSICTGERLISLLLIFSSESATLIQSLMEHLPPSAIATSFCLYLQSRGAGRTSTKLKPEHRDNPQDADLESLFEFLVTPLPRMEQLISELSAEGKQRLVKRAESLFPSLEGEGYGGFLQRQLTFLVYIAAPENPIAARIVPLVINAKKGAPELELLKFAGPKTLLQMITDLSDARGDQANTAAAILDAMRNHYPDALHILPSNILRKTQKSKDPALSLAVRAVTLKMELSDEDAFRRSLIRTIKSDKSGDSALWLAKNPEFLELLPLQKLPTRIFGEVISALTKVDPARTLKFLRTAANTYDRILEARTVSAVFEALERIGNQGNELFVDLAIRALHKDPEQVKNIFGREPNLSLLFRNIWSVALRSHDEKLWDIAFDAVNNKVTDTFALNWLKDAPAGRTDLQTWVQAQYVPRLFERGILSTRFLLGLRDPNLQVALTQILCGVILQRINFLQHLTAEWPKTRSAHKESLASRVATGLRIAARFANGNEAMLSTLSTLKTAIQEWRLSQSPTIDEAIASLAEIQIPKAEVESEQTLTDFFSRDLKTPHELGLFFALNPWALSMYLLRSNPGWPKFELVAEQLRKSLVFLSKLNSTATELAADLENNIKVDLAIALRDKLSDLDEMLAGYFVLRSMLNEMGLEEAVPSLGSVVKTENLSSELHKYIRDPSQKGRLRLFGLGIKVGDRIVSSARVSKSGDDDDRD